MDNPKLNEVRELFAGGKELKSDVISAISPEYSDDALLKGCTIVKDIFEFPSWRDNEDEAKKLLILVNRLHSYCHEASSEKLNHDKIISIYSLLSMKLLSCYNGNELVSALPSQDDSWIKETDSYSISRDDILGEKLTLFDGIESPVKASLPDSKEPKYGRLALSYYGIYFTLFVRAWLKKDTNMRYLFEKVQNRDQALLDKYYSDFMNSAQVITIKPPSLLLLTSFYTTGKVNPYYRTLLLSITYNFRKSVKAGEQHRYKLLNAVAMQTLNAAKIPAVGLCMRASASAQMGTLEFLKTMAFPSNIDTISDIIKFYKLNEGEKPSVYHYISRLINDNFFLELGRLKAGPVASGFQAIQFYHAGRENEKGLSLQVEMPDPREVGLRMLENHIYYIKSQQKIEDTSDPLYKFSMYQKVNKSVPEVSPEECKKLAREVWDRMRVARASSSKMLSLEEDVHHDMEEEEVMEPEKKAEKLPDDAFF